MTKNQQNWKKFPFSTARKVGLIKLMNEIVREDIGDDDLYEVWIAEGVPDGAGEDDFDYIAEDDSLYYQTIELFCKLTKLDLEIDNEGT